MGETLTIGPLDGPLALDSAEARAESDFLSEVVMRSEQTSAKDGTRGFQQIDVEAAAHGWFVNSPIPMWIYDRHSLRFLSVNDAATAAYGWSEAEFTAMTIADIRPAADVALLLRSVTEPRSDFQDSGPWTHVTKSGEHRRVNIYSHIIEHSCELAALVAAVDITPDYLNQQRVRAQFDLGVLAATTGLNGFLDHAAEIVSNVLDGARVGIHVVDADGTGIIVTSATCDVLSRIQHDQGDHIDLPAQNVIARVIVSCQQAVTNDSEHITAADRSDLRNPSLERFAIVPILRLGRCSAVVVSTNKTTRYVDHDLETMAVLGDLVLHLLDGLRSEEATRCALARYKQATWAAVNALSRATDARDPYTAGHQRRVSDLAVDIGSELGLGTDQLEFLKIAGALHDIGKIGLPAEILSKPGTLHPLEIELVRTHPQTGAQILADIEFPWPVQDVVAQHHERLDGSGYPDGLAGDQIRLEARIVAVADVVEAMCSHRPYRNALPLSAALDELSSGRGIRYDTAVVDAAQQILTNWHTRTYPNAT